MKLLELTYEPMPWQTHPIDIAHGPQGWGPFNGPYSPVNWADPATSLYGCGIDIYWQQGNNQWEYGPGYAEMTLLYDSGLGAINLVNNQQSLASQLKQAVVGGSTITQGVQAPTVAQQATSLLSQLMAGIKGALKA